MTGDNTVNNGRKLTKKKKRNKRPSPQKKKKRNPEATALTTMSDSAREKERR